MRHGDTFAVNHSATVLHPDDPADRETLERLRRDPAIEFVDRSAEQAKALRELLPAPDEELLGEPRRHVHYPWRRAVVTVLGPAGYRRLRLDRNHNLITRAEHDRLARLRVGVVGLSVGHAIAHTLAAQGVCGRLRLADFDELEVSNLNRVPATVFDVGVNKAVVAARRIAELDPYLPVEVFPDGLTRDNVDTFLDGVDIVVEECDSLDIKALVREAARRRRLPVLMATSDRGLIDVERFDLEPQRPPFHGLLPGVDSARLAGLTNQQKIPYVLRMVEAASLSARGAASLVEVGQTLSTWPQLSGDVALGGTVVAEAVRRIGLGEPLSSGRVRVDVAAALDTLRDPLAEPVEDPAALPAAEPPAPVPEPADTATAMAVAASLAPSGGNVQPWHIEPDPRAVVIRIAPEYSATMDVDFRASAVAVGAAAFNARIAAAARGALGPVEFEPGDEQVPLTATVRIGTGTDPELAALYPALAERETNRRLGRPQPLAAETVADLTAAAERHGGGLRLLTGRAALDAAADILAEADRIRYLTPRLHADMMRELRWPGRDCLDWGIDVRSLELEPAQLMTLDILRRPDVMARLAEWGGGRALGSDVRTRLAATSALAVLTVRGDGLLDYARGGAALQAAWFAAQRHGLAVHPVSPVFLYARDRDDLVELSPGYADELGALQRRFTDLVRLDPDESVVLVLRLSHAPRASVRSRRRPITGG